MQQTYQTHHSDAVSPKRSLRIEEFRLSSYIEESISTIYPYLIENLRHRSFGYTMKMECLLCSIILHTGSFYVPTSRRASRSLSALSIPVFSFVWFLKAACQYFKLHIRSLKSLNFNRPLPELCLLIQKM